MAVSHLLFVSGYLIDSTNNALRVTSGGSDYTCTITAGTYYLRGDGTADDLAEAIRDAYVAATPSADGDVSAGVVFDTDPANLGATLTMTDTNANWRPLHDSGFSTLAYQVTGWPATAVTAAASIASTTTPEVIWSPDVCGFRVKSRPALGRTHTTIDGTVYAWQRSPARLEVRHRFEYLHANRADAEVNTTDPGATFENWFARNRFAPLFEVWRVELDASGQFDFSGALDRDFLGAFTLDESTFAGGAQPVRPNPRVPLYNVEV